MTPTSPSALMMFLGQLLSQGAMLLVYIIGFVLCAFFWRRAPRAALLTAIGLALMVATTIGIGLLQAVLINTRGPATIGQTLMWIGLAGSIVRAIGLGLVLAGVFAERPQVASGFEVQSTPPTANFR